MRLLWCAQAADCYAFGILMWEIYTSNSAWANMSHAQVVRAVLTNRKLAWPDHVPAPYRCAPRPGSPPLMSEHFGMHLWQDDVSPSMGCLLLSSSNVNIDCQVHNRVQPIYPWMADPVVKPSAEALRH